MKENPTWLPVTAAALQASDGRWLMHKRPLHKHHGGLWEYPGGKVEKGETPASALVRELAEELGICVDVPDLKPACFAQTELQGGAPQLVIFLYTCRCWRGEPAALEGGEVAWYEASAIPALAMPPLDVTLTAALFAKVSG